MVGSYNREYIIEETISALLFQDYPKDCYEIILVDNGSTDNSIQIVEKSFNNDISTGKLKILALMENSGSAGTYNHALSVARQDWDYFLKMDEDLILDKYCVSALVKCAEYYPNTGMVGGKVFFHSEPTRLQTIGCKFSPFYTISKSIGKNSLRHKEYITEKKLDGVSGCMFLVSRKVKDRVGWFDQDYFLYYDDHDLMFKALKKGFNNYFTPRAIGYHDTSTGSLMKYTNSQWLYYSSRGGWMFFYKNYNKFSLSGVIYILSYFFRSIASFVLIIIISKGSNIKNLLGAYLSGFNHGLQKKTIGRFEIERFK